MRKSIALLLSIILVFTFSSVSVVAQQDDNRIDIEEIWPDNNLSLSLSDNNASPHSDVSLGLTLDNNSGFSVMILDLKYSTGEITLKSVTPQISGVSAEFSNYEGGSTVAFYHLGSNCVQMGLLATIVLGIGAYSGDADITLSAAKGNVCTANGAIIDTQFTGATVSVSCAHTYIFKDRVEPSCSKEGAINYICSICNDIVTTPINKAAHTYSSQRLVVQEPTCDEEGIEAFVCECCGDLKDQSVLEALGHRYIDENAFIVIKESTCTESGSKYRDCYVCNKRVITQTEPLGHDDGTWRTTIPSDCTSAGVVSLYCNRCDHVLETKEKEIGQHFMGWAVTKAPTCKEEGIEEYMCLICSGEVGESRTVAKLDHIHDKEAITREPTCSVKGISEIYCKNCNEVVSTKEIDTIPHIKNTLTVVTAPTSESEGQGEYRCKICDEVMESVTLPKTYGEFYTQTTVSSAGQNTSVKVFVKNNPGFSVGIVRIRYDETSLIYRGVNAGDITDDITAGLADVGQISVLISLEEAQFSENGLMFTVEFTLTEDAKNGNIELFYDAQNDFADQNGDRVFFNMISGEIQIVDSLPGDVNSDGKVNTTDLADIKLYLAAITDEVGPGADADLDGDVDTGYLAVLKLMLAGII